MMMMMMMMIMTKEAAERQSCPLIAGLAPIGGSYFIMGCCGAVGSTLAFESIGHGFESELSLFSHHDVSAFSKLRSLA